MSKPSFSSLKTFEVVARLGSLRAAGEALHITQSAVSHQIRRLEETLKLQLFEKQGRGIRLTPKGEQLSFKLREGFEILEDAIEAVINDKNFEQLRITCLPSIAVRWLIPRLNRFRSQFPEYVISFQYIDVPNTEIPSDVDVQITWFDGAPPGNSEKNVAV